MATASARLGAAASRSERIRLARRPLGRGILIVPGESVLVGAVVLIRNHVQQRHRIKRPETVGDAFRDQHRLAGLVDLSDARWTSRCPRQAVPQVDQADVGAPFEHNPHVLLAAVEMDAAQHAGGGARVGSPARTCRHPTARLRTRARPRRTSRARLRASRRRAASRRECPLSASHVPRPQHRAARGRRSSAGSRN